MKIIVGVLIFLWTITAVMNFNMVYDIYKDLHEASNTESYERIYYACDAMSQGSQGIFGTIEYVEYPEIHEEIASMKDVENVYPFEILGVSEVSRANEQVEMKDLFVDGNKLDYNPSDFNSSKPVYILPYYPEDGYDKEMKKIFLSKDLAKALDLEDVATSPKTLEIPQVLVPKAISNEQGYTVKGELVPMKLEIEGVLKEYHQISSAHRLDTPYFIFVPYQNIFNDPSIAQSCHVVFPKNDVDDTKLYKDIQDKYPNLTTFQEKGDSAVNYQIFFADQVKAQVKKVIILIFSIAFANIFFMRKAIESKKEARKYAVILFVASSIVSGFFSGFPLVGFVLTGFISLLSYMLVYKKEVIEDMQGGA